MSVRKSVLDKFVRLGGYKIVKRKKDGSWRNISEAQRKTGLSRPTIYRILEIYPEAPDKTLPKYVAEFKETEGLRRLEQLYVREQFFADMLYPIREAWKLLNKKDPISWGEEDFRKIWNSDKFLDPVTNFIGFHHSVNFRRLMKAIGRHDLLPKFKTKTRPKGAKKLWYLEDAEIIALAEAVEDPDLLIFILRGITEGSRMSGLKTTTPNKINLAEKVLMVYESKIKKWVEKIHTDKVIELTMRYVKDLKIKPTQPLHGKGDDYYYKQLQKAGQRAGIAKNVTPHILKHTFVSQAHKHAVSAETVSDQSHTEMRTLVAFYRASDEKKKRHELRGEEYAVMPFNEWVETVIYPAFERRYEELVRSN